MPPKSDAGSGRSSGPGASGFRLSNISAAASAIASREFSGPGRALNLVFAALDVAVV